MRPSRDADHRPARGTPEASPGARGGAIRRCSTEVESTRRVARDSRRPSPDAGEASARAVPAAVGPCEPSVRWRASLVLVALDATSRALFAGLQPSCSCGSSSFRLRRGRRRSPPPPSSASARPIWSRVRSVGTEVGSARARRRIREADQVIVICGRHTETSTCVSAELLIAQEERIPYLLALVPAGDHVHEAEWSQAGRRDAALRGSGLPCALGKRC